MTNQCSIVKLFRLSGLIELPRILSLCLVLTTDRIKSPTLFGVVDLKLGRETLSLAFPRSGMRQAFR